MTTARRRLLELCARPTLTPAATDALGALLRDFTDWQQLPVDAENERMVPLLSQHLAALSVRPPAATRRLLAAYLARQRALAERQQRGLRRAVQVCRDMGVEVLLLKGAALVSTVYADAALRPMDDLDLLLPADAVSPVRASLLKHGFVGPPSGGRYERPHHAAPVIWTEDGFQVSVELHRYFPAGGRAERWDPLRQNAVPRADVFGAWTPQQRDLLWQVYHHAFRSTLRWVPWRLIWVADLVGLLTLGAADSESARETLSGLALLHLLTPLPENVLSHLGGLPLPHRHVGKVYGGWPYRKLSPRTLWCALTPPDWWLQLRHGVRGQSRRHCLQRHFGDLWHEWLQPWDGLPCK